MSEENSFDSAWDAIADTRDEAENMKIRSQLMMQITGIIKGNAWTQKEAARAFGVTQPRISDLVRGKIQLFTVDTLITMLSSAGWVLRVHAEPKVEAKARTSSRSKSARTRAKELQAA